MSACVMNDLRVFSVLSQYSYYGLIWKIPKQQYLPACSKCNIVQENPTRNSNNSNLWSFWVRLTESMDISWDQRRMN